MAIKLEVSKDLFVEICFKHPSQFGGWSVDELSAFFDCLESWSSELDEDIDFDPIALACEWTKYTSDELLSEFYHLFDNDLPEENKTIDDLVELISKNNAIYNYGKTQHHLGFFFVMEG